MHRELLPVLAVTLLVAAPAARAQAPVAVGAQFQINTYTTNAQTAPSVAMDAGGSFVVVWQSYGDFDTGDASGYSIQRQQFASNGDPLGGQFLVNTYTTNNQRRPSVAMDAGGNFVVVWHSFGSDDGDTSGYSVQGRQFASNGDPLGGQFQVNTYTTSFQRYASVAADAGGNFVVVWDSLGDFPGGDTSIDSVQGRQFAANGDPLGGQFLVNTYTTFTQSFPAVAMDAGGDFVVVWESYGDFDGGDTSSDSVQGRQFAANGNPIGGQFLVNTYTTFTQSLSAVAADGGGNFVVVWQSLGDFPGGDSSATSVQGRQFASNGDPPGGQFLVNAYTTNDQRLPSVAVDGGGNFVVVWSSLGDFDGGDSSAYSVQGQRFAANGDPLGGQFLVNTYTTNDQKLPSVAVDAKGDFVVVWQSDGSGGDDTSGATVQGQRFRVTGDIGDLVWADNNGNGIQDGGEPGVTGVTVSLLDGIGSLVDSAATDANGEYLFTQVPAGDHSIVVELPPGYEFTLPNSGADDTIDSDVDADGASAVFSVMAAVTDLTRDAGLAPLSQLGDLVWLDTNADGIQDGGELGVAGVTVSLYRDSMPPTLAGTDVTDVTGAYGFMVSPGTYYLEIACIADAFTLLDQGGNEVIDSDVDPATATTSSFLVGSGTDDFSRDAGLVDSDSDGVVCSDNCPDVANASQEDADGDGFGDVCDLCTGNDATGDADGDGLCADRDCDDSDPGNACAVFSDGFEVGDTSAWSGSVP